MGMGILDFANKTLQKALTSVLGNGIIVIRKLGKGELL